MQCHLSKQCRKYSSYLHMHPIQHTKLYHAVTISFSSASWLCLIRSFSCCITSTKSPSMFFSIFTKTSFTAHQTLTPGKLVIGEKFLLPTSLHQWHFGTEALADFTDKYDELMTNLQCVTKNNLSKKKQICFTALWTLSGITRVSR